MEETEIGRRGRRTLDAALANDHVSVRADSDSIDIATADEDAVRLDAPGTRYGLGAMRFRDFGAIPSLALGFIATQSLSLIATRSPGLGAAGLSVSQSRRDAMSRSRFPARPRQWSMPPVVRPASASAIVRAQLIS